MKAIGGLIILLLIFGFIFICVSFQPAFCNQTSAIIQINNDLLTIRAKSTPLKQVLASIEDQTQIKVFLLGTVDKPISANLSDVPIEKGLKRIFRNFNSVFIYHSTNDIENKLEIKSILILPMDENDLSSTSFNGLNQSDVKTSSSFASEQGAGPDFRGDAHPEFGDKASNSSVLIEDEKTLNELSDELLGNDEPETRADAADTLGSLGDEEAIVFLIQALEDSDGEVRKSAVEALALIGSDEAIPYIKSILNDSSEEVRSAAKNALKEFEE